MTVCGSRNFRPFFGGTVRPMYSDNVGLEYVYIIHPAPEIIPESVKLCSAPAKRAG